jgi:O-antigen/teichoic acid export membrane protein
VTHKWTLIVLAIGTAVQVAGGPAVAILLLTGHEGSYIPVVGGNVALRLLGFAVLVPRSGVLGAAIACTVSLVIATVVLNGLCRRRTGLDPSILILRRRIRNGPLVPQTSLPKRGRID